MRILFLGGGTLVLISLTDRSEEKPKRYAPITAGQYVDMRLNATYAK